MDKLSNLCDLYIGRGKLLHPIAIGTLDDTPRKLPIFIIINLFQQQTPSLYQSREFFADETET